MGQPSDRVDNLQSGRLTSKRRHHAGGIAADHRLRRHVSHNHSPGGGLGPVPQPNTRQDDGVGSQKYAFAYGTPSVHHTESGQDAARAAAAADAAATAAAAAAETAKADAEDAAEAAASPHLSPSNPAPVPPAAASAVAGAAPSAAATIAAPAAAGAAAPKPTAPVLVLAPPTAREAALQRLECFLRALLSGCFSGLTGFCAKAVVCCVTSMFAERSAADLSRGEFWVFLLIFPISMVLQVRAMSAALRDFDAMVMVPMYQSCIVLVGVSWGWLYYNESAGLSDLDRGFFVLGCLLTLLGILVLALRQDAAPPPQAEEAKAAAEKVKEGATAVGGTPAPKGLLEAPGECRPGSSSTDGSDLVTTSPIAELRALSPPPRAATAVAGAAAPPSQASSARARPPKLLSQRALSPQTIVVGAPRTEMTDAARSPVTSAPAASAARPPLQAHPTRFSSLTGIDGGASGGASAESVAGGGEAGEAAAHKARAAGSAALHRFASVRSHAQLLRAASHAMLVVAHAQGHDEDEDEDAWGGVGEHAHHHTAGDSRAVVVHAPAALTLRSPTRQLQLS